MNNVKVTRFKTRISKILGYPTDHIIFFGSRISGIPRKNSDLDVAILDQSKIYEDIFVLRVCGIRCEIRYVEDLDMSWLKNGR